MSSKSTNDSNPPQPQTTLNLHSSPDALAERTLRLNNEGTVIFSSPNPEEDNIHCPNEDLTGLSIEDILPVDIAKRFREKLESVRQTALPQLIRYQQKTGNTVRFFEANISPCKNGEFDVSLQTLPDSSNPAQNNVPNDINFQALVSRLPGALYRCAFDRRWTVLYVSAGITEFLGYQPDDFTAPDGLGFIDIAHPPDQPYIRHLVEQASHRNAPFTIEYRMVHTDGSLRWVNEQGQTIFDDDGKPAYIEGIIMDVTESFRQRQKSSFHTAQLSSISTLGAGVAHEINNALAIMMANLDYAVEELDHITELATDDQRLLAPLNDISHSLSKLDEGMTRVQRIVHDLRSYSDVAADQYTETFDLVRLLEWAMRETSNLKMHDKVVPCFPDEPVFMYGNKLRLLQVLTHLFSNADKSFSSTTLPKDQPDNKITISLKPIDPSTALIEIQDNGAGIPPEVLPHVFEPFFSTRSTGEGTGLGLFVCQGIIHSIGGEILISSTPNQGTTVQVILPTKLPAE